MGRTNRQGGREVRESFIFICFFFSSFLSQIYRNRTVDFVRAEGKIDPCNEGYAWTPKA